MLYYEKYLKYKAKYLSLKAKSQNGGSTSCNPILHYDTLVKHKNFTENIYNDTKYLSGFIKQMHMKIKPIYCLY